MNALRPEEKEAMEMFVTVSTYQARAVEEWLGEPL
jgi:hypothetical protein